MSGTTFCGSLEATEGRAHFVHLPTVKLDGDALYLEELTVSAPEAAPNVVGLRSVPKGKLTPLKTVANPYGTRLGEACEKFHK